MHQHHNIAERSAWILAIGVALLLIGFRISAGAIIERGDGVAHYMIARWSWRYPQLLLDHWGKPLFTLLASPFAQLGHFGPALFNVIVAFVTMALGLVILRRNGSSGALLYPLFIVSAPQYVLMVIGGMTEPLFGLLTVAVLWCFTKEQYTLGSIIASFTPFSRPEFIVYLPFVFLWLVIIKRWRAVPWLGFGSLVYSAAGWFLIDDWLWFLNNDPYTNGPSIYGSGDPWIFTRRLDDITGRPLMVLSFLAIVIAPLISLKETVQRLSPYIVLALLPAIFILAIHMLLWALGIKGSAGILRVASTMVPMLALFTCSLLNTLILRLNNWLPLSNRFMAPAFVLVALWSGIDMFNRRIFPIPVNEDEKALRRIGAQIMQELRPDAKLFTTHPFMGLMCDADTYNPERYEMAYGDNALLSMRRNDILFWDTELGPNESGIAFERLWNDTSLTLIAYDEPDRGHKVIRHVYYELFAFKHSPSTRRRLTDTIFSSAEVGLSKSWELPAAGPEFLLTEFEIELQVFPKKGASQQLILVYEEKADGTVKRYRQEELDGGPERIVLRVNHQTEVSSRKIRFIDHMNLGAVIKDFKIIRHRWIQSSK